MHGEEIFKKDPEKLPDFLHQFCTQTLPGYYLNRCPRIKWTKAPGYDEVEFDGGVVSRVDKKTNVQTITRRGRVLMQGDDVCMPALWLNQPALIAYSLKGYKDKTWELAPTWTCAKVRLYRLSQEGAQAISGELSVKDKKLTLSLDKDEAVLIVPAEVRNILQVLDK
jgi:hypothetical protein